MRASVTFSTHASNVLAAVAGVVARAWPVGVALAALIACAGPEPPPVIEAGRVGRVAIGDTLAAIEAAYAAERRRATEIEIEGTTSPAVEIEPQGAALDDALVAEFVERDGALRVFRIQVRDPVIETASGVGVGDTVGELRARYALDRLVAGEGNVGIRVESLAATFLLDRDAVETAWTQTSDASVVPDAVRIRRILLTCPLAGCENDAATAREIDGEASPAPPSVGNRETFADAARGLSFEYPAALGTEYIHAVDWPPALAVEDGPFTCTEAGVETPRAGRTEAATIDGREFCVTRVAEGAAGSVYTLYAYATPIGGQVAILTFSLRAVQCGNYDEPRRRACEAERAAFSVDPIVAAIADTVRLGRDADKEP